MGNDLTILGLESSCDDTGAAVLRVPADAIEAARGRTVSGLRAQILSNVVFGQTEMHAPFGGVVPEIAARAHAERIDIAAARALDVGGVGLDEIDAIAVTAGPGLIGGVLSGVMFARGLAVARGLPLYAVNHLAGHALTPRLTDGVDFPYLVLLASGGHCQILLVEGRDRFSRLGGTIDDAPGEAFDKTARLLGLPQPGGPEIERTARDGNPAAFALPRPLLDRPGCDMSFSGLKTAVLRQRDRLIERDGGLHAQDRADLCASFQQAVADVLAEKTARALAILAERHPAAPQVLAVAGGVAANGTIRAALQAVCDRAGASFTAPPLALCTDNAAMIAWAAAERILAGDAPDAAFSARPRWPLDQASPALLGSGKKGAKA